MTTYSGELSKAVVVFLGFGHAPFPIRDEVRLIAEFGSVKAEELKPLVLLVIEEVEKSNVDWSDNSLESAAENVVDAVHTRHPELDRQALEALKWKFTYDWR